MGRLDVIGVAKSYGEVPVLRGLDLSIAQGEFFTLLGPSGCGKTTLLRTIAGFLRQDQGEIRVDGDRIDSLPTHRRDIGMVFQDYAIFPHLSVADNVAFGLKARRLPKAEIAARVEESLRMVQLTGYGGRFPSELSGGQQQRVGLARAMAIRPRLLLMDEPLSNLDAKLRVELREDIRDLQKRLGITTIYVTHDQEEALAISDRICVMNGGVAEQVGAPFDIYRNPIRRFAAAFIGTMNFIGGTVVGGAVRLGDRPLGLRADRPDGPVDIAIRPENIALSGDPASGFAIAGQVRKATFLGREAHYTLSTPEGDLVAQLADPAPGFLAMEGRAATAILPLDRVVVFAPDGALVATTRDGGASA